MSMEQEHPSALLLSVMLFAPVRQRQPALRRNPLWRLTAAPLQPPSSTPVSVSVVIHEYMYTVIHVYS